MKRGYCMDAVLEARDEVRRALKPLTGRHAAVVTARFGLGWLGGEVLGYGEIGEALDVCASRVRQIEEEGLERMRVEIERMCAADRWAVGEAARRALARARVNERAAAQRLRDAEAAVKVARLRAVAAGVAADAARSKRERLELGANSQGSPETKGGRFVGQTASKFGTATPGGVRRGT